MNTDAQIVALLEVLQESIAAKLDAHTLIQRYSGRAMLIARSGYRVGEKWRKIEEARQELRAGLIGLCAEYHIPNPLPAEVAGKGVPHAGD